MASDATTGMTRPSDEITGEVVAKWYEAVNPPTGKYTDYYNRFWIENGEVWASTRDHPDTKDYYENDPRDDESAALELLRHTLNSMGKHYAMLPDGGDGGWMIFDTDKGDDFWIFNETSGPTFRYAVVRLAAKVMGIEEVEGG